VAEKIRMMLDSVMPAAHLWQVTEVTLIKNGNGGVKKNVQGKKGMTSLSSGG
jgi:hypothetical protein